VNIIPIPTTFHDPTLNLLIDNIPNKRLHDVRLSHESLNYNFVPNIFSAPTPVPAVVAERPDLSKIDPDLLSYITKEEFGHLKVSDKTKNAIATVMKYR
jgi:hypothetical protein